MQANRKYVGCSFSLTVGELTHLLGILPLLVVSAFQLRIATKALITKDPSCKCSPALYSDTWIIVVSAECLQ